MYSIASYLQILVTVHGMHAVMDVQQLALIEYIHMQLVLSKLQQLAPQCMHAGHGRLAAGSVHLPVYQPRSQEWRKGRDVLR